MTEKRDIEEDLRISPQDGIYQGIKGGISAIPVFGGPVSNIITHVIPSPLEKRKTKWLINIDQRVAELEKSDKRFTNEALAENENFISIFIHASSVAIRTHQEEKLKALQNAVINSAVVTNLDENVQMLFLNLIDRYTPLHLKALSTFREPRRCRYIKRRIVGNIPDYYLDGNSYITKEFLPELDQREDLFKLVIRDLHDDGLVYNKELQGPQHVEHGITSLGMEFLQFISSAEDGLDGNNSHEGAFK